MIRWARSLPVTIKIPLIVVLIVASVSIVISERVLNRLGHLQLQHVDALAAAYLDGLSSALLPAMLRDDVWEAFDALDRAQNLYSSLRPVEAIVTNEAGEVVAATNPDHIPVLSQFPGPLGSQFAEDGLALNEDGTRAFLKRSLVFQDRSIGTIYSTLDISHLVAERSSVLRTLVATNGVLALVFAALGYAAVNRVVQPVRTLANHLEEGLTGPARPIGPQDFPNDGSPFHRVFTSYNALVAAERERETLSLRLAEEEKVASLGRLASGMAHEINNPLGGLFNAIDTLKAHGEKPVVRYSSLALIERGLSGIRDVVRATLTTYRSDQVARPIAAQDFQDLQLLLGPELRRKHQTIDWQVGDGALPVLPSTPIRQAVLNLLLNASAASGEGGRISFSIRATAGSELIAEVSDSGPGMPEDAAAILAGERPHSMLQDGKGLGLWMVRRLVSELGGRIELGRSSLGGARIRLVFGPAPATEVTERVA